MDEAHEIVVDEVTAEELSDGPAEDVSDGTQEEPSRVQAELDRLRDLVSHISLDDLRHGDWFAELLTDALHAYARRWTPTT